jgi:hypothetical protein
MTLREFQELSFESQIKLLDEHSGPISIREDDDHKVILRMIDGFFVEVYYKFMVYDKVSKINAFDSIDNLLPWVFKLANRPANQIIQKKIIVHHDDHQLFSDGFKKIIEKNFSEVQYKYFDTVWKALDYIIKCSENSIPISLVVSDFNHPGINGYRFARMVKDILGKHTPVMILSMTSIDNRFVKRGLEENVIDFYLEKSSQIDTIVAKLNSIMA